MAFYVVVKKIICTFLGFVALALFAEEVKNTPPLGSRENPMPLQVPKGGIAPMNEKSGVKTMVFSPTDLKFDASTDASIQTSYIGMMASLDSTLQGVFEKSYLALIYHFGSKKDEGLREFKALLQDKTAVEIMQLARPYLKNLPQDSKLDASSERAFQESLAFAMLGLSTDEKKEVAGAVAKVIMRGAKKGLDTEASIKVLHKLTCKEVITYAKNITEVELPQEL